MPSNRKLAKIKHLEACLRTDVLYTKSTGLDAVHLPCNSIPELTLQQVDVSTEICGKKIAAPLMIAPMTGGMERGAELNQLWAKAAEKYGIPMGVGSQRLALEDPNCAQTFRIRQHAPTIPIFANFGAAQLVKGWGVSEVRQAVAMIEADAIFIHINSMQEACQGVEADFRGVLAAISRLCEELDGEIPVWVREVGFGLSEKASQLLFEAGVSGIDCAGAGGTSWSKVEALCADNVRQRRRAETFGEWGVPTAQSIENVRAQSATLPLIATGGLKNGLDVVKALYLGADVGAMARPMLLAAMEGQESLEYFIEDTILEIKMALFGAGFSDIKSLRSHLRGAR